MSGIGAAAQRAGRPGRGLLPTGQLLTPEVWARRHHRAGPGLLGRLEGLARTDPLTGVPNRRVWEEELPGSWSGPGGWAPGCAWP